MIICRIKIKYYVVGYGPRVWLGKNLGKELSARGHLKVLVECVCGQTWLRAWEMLWREAIAPSNI